MKTRKQRAAALLARLEEGPSMHKIGMSDEEIAGAEAALELYKVWVTTWIIPDVRALILELREA